MFPCVGIVSVLEVFLSSWHFMLLALHAPIPDPMAKQAMHPHSLLVKLNLYIQVQGLIFLRYFFGCGPVLKSLLICYNIVSVLCFGFGCKACRILAPSDQGLKLHLHWKVKY